MPRQGTHMGPLIYSYVMSETRVPLSRWVPFVVEVSSLPIVAPSAHYAQCPFQRLHLSSPCWSTIEASYGLR